MGGDLCEACRQGQGAEPRYLTQYGSTFLTNVGVPSVCCESPVPGAFIQALLGCVQLVTTPRGSSPAGCGGSCEARDLASCPRPATGGASTTGWSVAILPSPATSGSRFSCTSSASNSARRRSRSRCHSARWRRRRNSRWRRAVTMFPAERMGQGQLSVGPAPRGGPANSVSGRTEPQSPVCPAGIGLQHVARDGAGGRAACLRPGRRARLSVGTVGTCRLWRSRRRTARDPAR